MNPRLLLSLSRFLILGIIFEFLPLLTRRGIFFSATVAPEFPHSPTGRRVMRSFQAQIAIWTVLACLLSLLFPWRSISGQVIPILLLLSVCSISYWRKFREVHTRYGSRVPELRRADLSRPAVRQSFSPWVFVPPLLALAAVALYLHANWNQLPEQYPIHFGLNGEPNRWATRDLTNVYLPLLIGAGLNFFLFGFAWLLSRVARNTAMLYVTLRTLQAVAYPLTFTVVIASLLPVWHPPVWLIPVVMLGFVAGLIYWGYGKISAPAARDAVPEPVNDNYWKAGMFYYNPEDPAIFVAKRVGIGYTMNFASKWAWLMMIGLLLTALLPLFLIHPK